jgi:hypothetical protein
MNREFHRYGRIGGEGGEWEGEGEGRGGEREGGGGRDQAKRREEANWSGRQACRQAGKQAGGQAGRRGPTGGREVPSRATAETHCVKFLRCVGSCTVGFSTER